LFCCLVNNNTCVIQTIHLLKVALWILKTTLRLTSETNTIDHLLWQFIKDRLDK